MNWFKLGLSLFWAGVGMACFTAILLSLKFLLSFLPTVILGGFIAGLLLAALTFCIYRDIKD